MQSRQPVGQSTPQGHELSHSEWKLNLLIPLIWFQTKFETLKFDEAGALTKRRIAVLTTSEVIEATDGQAFVADFLVAEKKNRLFISFLIIHNSALTRYLIA